MDKFYFHNISNSSDVKLVKIKGNAVINIIGNKQCITLIITENGYYNYGSINKNFDIYKDKENNYFIIRKKSDDYFRYITITVQTENYGYSKTELIENFVSDTLNKLSAIKSYHTYNNINSDLIPANSEFTYDSINNRKQYSACASLLLVSVRNSNGNKFSNMYLLYRNVETTITDYILQDITSNTTESITIKSTNTGIKISSNADFRVSITEISNT